MHRVDKTDVRSNCSVSPAQALSTVPSHLDRASREQRAADAEQTPVWLQAAYPKCREMREALRLPAPLTIHLGAIEVVVAAIAG